MRRAGFSTLKSSFSARIPMAAFRCDACIVVDPNALGQLRLAVMFVYFVLTLYFNSRARSGYRSPACCVNKRNIQWRNQRGRCISATSPNSSRYAAPMNARLNERKVIIQSTNAHWALLFNLCARSFGATSSRRIAAQHTMASVVRWCSPRAGTRFCYISSHPSASIRNRCRDKISMS